MKTRKAGKDKRRFLTVPLALTKKKEKHDMGLILGYIRLCMNRSGIANPSHKNIAENVGISEKTVRRLLAKAKKEGWVDWSSGRGSHESNFYSFPASSDWLQDEYKVDQTMALIGQNDNDLDKPSSVKLEPSSVKSDPLIGQNDTPHRSQLRPTNIYNKGNKDNKKEKIGASLQEKSFLKKVISVKEKEKPKEADKTGMKDNETTQEQVNPSDRYYWSPYEVPLKAMFLKAGITAEGVWIDRTTGFPMKDKELEEQLEADRLRRIKEYQK